MEISGMGLKIAAGAGASAAVATPPALGFVYKDQISSYFSGSKVSESSPSPSGTETQTPSNGIGQNTQDENPGRQTPQADDEVTQKLKALGIECKFDTDQNKKDCGNLDEAKLKKINFLDKGNDELTIETNTNVKLIMEKEADATVFTDKLKFTFTTDKDVKAGSNKIILKKGTNPEFKIKDGNKLEKAWDYIELGKKVNLTCTSDKCSSTKDKTVNLEESSSSKTLDAKWPELSQKITVTKDVENYNQGFKFTVENASDGISLTTSESVTKKLEHNSNYEIKLGTDNK